MHSEDNNIEIEYVVLCGFYIKMFAYVRFMNICLWMLNISHQIHVVHMYAFQISCETCSQSFYSIYFTWHTLKIGMNHKVCSCCCKFAVKYS